MRWVPVAANRPNRCAAIPFLSAHDSKGFIDTGTVLPGWDPHVYVSVVALEEMARLIGWHPSSQQAAYDRVLTAKDEELERLRAENMELAETISAIDVIESSDFTARKKRGPKAKAVA